MRPALQQRGDVVAGHLQAGRLPDRRRIRLVGALVEHGRKAEATPRARLLDQDFLLVVIDGRDAHLALDHYVGLAVVDALLVDALAGSKGLQLDLRREHRGLFRVEH